MLRNTVSYSGIVRFGVRWESAHFDLTSPLSILLPCYSDQINQGNDIAARFFATVNDFLIC